MSQSSDALRLHSHELDPAAADIAALDGPDHLVVADRQLTALEGGGAATLGIGF